MRILIVTIANKGINYTGVGRYYNQIANILGREGHDIHFFNHPNQFVIEKVSLKNTIMPYFAGVFSKRFAEVFSKLKPDAVHIQSEVGLGIAARNFCISQQIPYSSSYHTHWDIGMAEWLHLPAAKNLMWHYMRWFYKPAQLIHACTENLKLYLQTKGIKNKIVTFPLGVDLNEFHYDPDPTIISSYPRPYFMALSRVAREKNLKAFLDLKLPGTKFVIGEGAHKKYLQKKYCDAVFLPYRNVRNVLSMGDVFVFPSRFDTFGLTNLEALACGLPIAAFPVMGPLDIIEQGISGYTSENLQEAALACLSLKKDACIARAQQFTWEKTAHAFLKHQILLNN